MKIITSLLTTALFAGGLIGGVAAGVGAYLAWGDLAGLGVFAFVTGSCWFYAAALALLGRIERHLKFLAHGPESQERTAWNIGKLLW